MPTNDLAAPFDWAGLAGSVVLANAGQGPDAAIAILQREIEAAFVPVQQRDKAEALLCQRTNEYIAATARAEAAEARNKVLERELAELRGRISAIGFGFAQSDNDGVLVNRAQTPAAQALGGEHA
jgi:hypothetical protein